MTAVNSLKNVHWEKLFYAAILGGFGFRSLIVIFRDHRLMMDNILTSVHGFVAVFCFYAVFYLMRNN